MKRLGGGAPAPHYQHSEIGFNYRMSNILAAIGRGQLKALEDRVAQNAISSITTPKPL